MVHDEDVIARRVAVFKALGHETRARTVEILAQRGEMSVGELAELLGFDQSTVSKHLSVLRAAGVVSSRKEGLNVVYRLRTPCVYQFMTCVDRLSDGARATLACAARQTPEGQEREVDNR